MTNRSRMPKYFRTAVILLIVWIAVIFGHSLQPAYRSGMESLWVLHLLEHLFSIKINHNLLRKLAHFTEFFILGILCSAVFLMLKHSKKYRWSVFAFVLLGVMTALSDETIQLFVEGRNGDVRDIWIDVSGAVIGTVVTSVCAVLIRRIRKSGHKTGYKTVDTDTENS